MRITDIRERTVPIAAPIANAYIDFREMTLSLVAVVTDVVRDGRPVVGYDLQLLRDEMRGYLERGYTVVKMKVGGAPLAEDRRRIEAVLELLGPGERLAVDANGRFDLPTALAYAEALGQYELFWFEEPATPLDFELQRALGDAYPGPMATGENLFSVQDARNLVRYGGMRPDRDWLQFDPALSYGLVEYLRTLAS